MNQNRIVIPGAAPEPLPEDAPAPVIIGLEPCPKCGAKPEKRMDASGFGGKRVVICRECGNQF